MNTLHPVCLLQPAIGLPASSMGNNYHFSQLLQALERHRWAV